MSPLAEELLKCAAECRATAKELRDGIVAVVPEVRRAEIQKFARQWDEMAARLEVIANDDN